MSKPNHNLSIPIVEQYAAATVVGLGATGFSVVRYLCARGLDVKVLDSRSRPQLADRLAKDYPMVSAQYGEFQTGDLDGMPLVVVSPGVSLKEPMLRSAKQNGALVVGDIELFLQENQRPVIAITGSNGKSTVTTLVGAMIRSGGMEPLVAGNIGLPALDALTDEKQYEVAVLELSSFQLESISQVPAIAVAILNISADHMDRYDSMGDYTLAKARILRGGDVAVLPRHDEQLKQITNINRVVTFDLDQPSNDDEYGVVRESNGRWLVKGTNRLIRLKEIPLLGLHNVKNVLAAYALVDGLQLPLEKVTSAVKTFTGLAHRMETVAEFQGVTWVNDSKATNIGAASTALCNLERDIIWIAGGQGKGADFDELKDALTNSIKLLILIGEDAPLIERSLAKLVPIIQAADMQAAVTVAAEQAKVGSIVLLSPACASFDMFDSFEHRGNEFTAQVQAYISEGSV